MTIAIDLTQLITAEDKAALAAEEAAAKARADALQTLADTDWYVVRQAETGKEIPQEIRDQRAAARALL